MRRERRKRQLVGFLSVVVGATTIVLLWPPGENLDWGLWSIFAGAYVLLDLKSVEVNDRQLASSSSMVVLTAGVYYATLDDSTPLLALALLAGVGFLGPADFREHRVFVPAINFGQQVVSAVATAFTLTLFIEPVELGTRVRGRELLITVGATVAAAFVYFVVNITLVNFGVRAAYGATQVIPWSRLGMLGISQVSMAVLGGLLGAVLFQSDNAAIPLILMVYVVGLVVYVSYSKLREAHESTLSGFILALEARDLYTRGHTERVVHFCRLIGDQLAFTGTQLERMRWAAIIHDMGKLAIPVEIIQKQGQLSDDEYRELRRSSHRVDDLLSEVDFLRPMVTISSGAHTRLGSEDFGQVGHSHTTRPNLEQKVLAVADAFDAMTSTRGYRMALSQAETLESLRDHDNPLFDNDVIDALEKGLAGIGQTYGPRSIRIDAGEEAANA